MSGSDRHAGDRLAALADGRLTEPERGRVLDHLVRCAGCRAEYDAQLAMKGLLGHLTTPGAPVDLQARLSGLAVEGEPPSRAPERHGRRRVPRRPPRSTRARVGRAGAGVLSFAVLGLAGAYALGGGPEGAPVTPPVDRYVREHAAVSGGLPFTEPVLWQLPQDTWVQQVSRPAGTRALAARGTP
jgi:anti-sigma factor RsiW